MPEIPPVSAIADVEALWGLDGWMTPPLEPVVAPARPLMGRARTVQLAVLDSGPGMAPAFELLSQDLTGQVLVWAGAAEVPGATWGGILARAARSQGATAVLVDGAVRDVTEMATLGLATYASRRAVVGPNGTVHAVGVDVPVRIGDVEVRPGDAVVVDDAGCVRIRAEHGEEVLAAAAAYAAGEDLVVGDLDQGHTLVEAYPHKKKAVAALKEVSPRRGGPSR